MIRRPHPLPRLSYARGARAALRRWGAAGGAAALAAGLAGPRPAAAQEGFHVTELAPGVWAAEVVARPPFYAFANSLVVEVGDGVLVVDTQQSTAAARDLIGAIRGLTAKPVRWVVNTHLHGDHVYGNAAYREAFPGVRFLGHASTARDVRERTAAMLRDEVAALPGTVAEREAWLSRGVGPDGRPLDEAGRERVRYSLEVNRRQLADLRDLELVAPDPIADSIVIGSGRRRVHVVHVGPAHTEGDVVVWLPGERVAAVGDLLEEGLPWVEGSYPAGWARALARVEALVPAVVVPAHGAVQRDGRLLATQAALFRGIADAVATLEAEGVPWEAMPARLELEGMRKAAVGSGPGARERWRAFVAAAVEALRGERGAEGPG